MAVVTSESPVIGDPARPPLAGLDADQLAEKVRRCMSVARRMIADGVGDTDMRPDLHGTLSSRVTALLGHDGPRSHEPNDHYWRMLDEFGQAAYALGIAVGLQLRATAFDK